MTTPFKLRRILQCAMLSTSLTLISDLQSMPGSEKESAASSQSVSVKLTPQDRTEMRDRLYPYFVKLLGQEEAEDFKVISQEFEPQKLRRFMGEVDTFKRVYATFFLSNTSLNLLSAIRILEEFYPESEKAFPLKGRYNPEGLGELQKAWTLIQEIEGEPDRTFATQAFYNLTSRIYVNLSDYGSFAEIKGSYPWLRSFAIDIERIDDEDVQDVVRSKDLQGLKFYGTGSHNREFFGVDGDVHYTHFDEVTQSLDQESFDGLARILPWVTLKLAHIKFAGLGLNEAQFDCLFGCLLRFKGLKSLGLSHDPLTSVSAQRLSKLLMQLPQLEILRLSECSLDTNGLGVLRSQIKKLPLYELKLSKFNLTEVGVDHLAKALENHPTVRNLKLGNINPADEQRFYPFTPQEREEIASEEEEDEDISPQALEKFGNIISSLKLHTLHVWAGSGESSVHDQIVLSGVRIPSLKQLRFNFHEADDESSSAFLERLSQSSVEILEGGMSTWRTEHFVQMTEALEQGSSLQELDFSKRSSSPRPGDEEEFVPSEIVDRFAASLKASFITDLGLSNWKFQEEDLLKIVNAVAEIPFFCNLELSNTGITTPVLQRLLEVMKSRPHFVSLDINRNDLSEEDSAMILDALEEMEESNIHVSPPEIEWLEEDHYSPPTPDDPVDPYTIEEGGGDPAEFFSEAQGLLFGLEKEE